MTYRERLRIEHPEELGPLYVGGCYGCPGHYWGAAPHSRNGNCLAQHREGGIINCRACWDQEAPEPPKPTPPKPTPPKRRKLVYIAGPITGVAKYWEPFEEMAEEVRAVGYIPLIPTWQPEGLSNAQYMRMCLAMLDAADAVLLLPGWRDSIGATIEAAYAAYVEKPTAESIEKLKEALSK